MDSLGCVIDTIISSSSQDGVWQISKEALKGCLGLDELTYLQTAYSVRDGASFLTRETFGPVETIFILELLEASGCAEAEREFVRNGLHISLERGAELQMLFIDHCAEVCRGHAIDSAYFRQLLGRSHSFYDAVERYLESVVDRNAELTRFCVNVVSKKSYRRSEIASHRVRWYLDMLFARHVLEWKSLLGTISDELKRLFGKPDVPPIPESLSNAFSMLGFAGEAPSHSELHARYKALMLKYHPDINPEGLERAKRVNEAYAQISQHQDVVGNI